VSPDTDRLNEAVERVIEPVIEATDPCGHIMAFHFDSRADHGHGVIRCIVRREGSVQVSGFVDRSQVHLVERETPYEADMGPEIAIQGAKEVVNDLPEYDRCEFLGFEDPNLWCHLESETIHYYCTIPFRDRDTRNTALYLGHAEGDSVDSLTMTEPVLYPEHDVHSGAKEVAIAPRSSAGHRYNLVESQDTVENTSYSVLRTAIAPDLSGPWEYGEIAYHPAHDSHDWCAGHVSPAPLLPRSFVDVGDSRRVGLLNGREQNRRVEGEILFGTFSVGLMVYNYEDGIVEWVSEDPLVSDPDAETITFASAFEQTNPDCGVMYAHVDDSYVRAYHLDAEQLASRVPDRVLAGERS
jgi:hypothetical protein